MGPNPNFAGSLDRGPEGIGMIRICMVGTGYVGLVSGACMADFGHQVCCVDINEERIKDLRKGIIPFYEPGLDRLVLKSVDEQRKDLCIR